MDVIILLYCGMKTIVVKDLAFRIYSEADEVPMHNFHLMYKYALYASGIGSVNDISKRFNRLLTYLQNEDTANAIEETNNLMAAHYLALQGIDPDNLSLCCLIHSINGLVVNDYSQENLIAMDKILSKGGVSKIQLSAILEEVKKNFNIQLSLKFPKYFGGDDEYHFRQTILWIQLSCDKLLGNETKRLKEIENYFYELNKPKNFNEEDPLSAINQHEKQFEKLCAMLQKQVPNDVEKISAVKFYSLLETFEKPSSK